MSRRNKEGFTLVELMVVVLVMALLAGIIIGISGLAGKKAAEGRARAELENLRTALEEYRLLKGYYAGYPQYSTQLPLTLDMTTLQPQILDELRAVASNRMVGVDLVFEDPWASSYRYELISRHSFRVWSRGPDGLDETAEERVDDIR